MDTQQSTANGTPKLPPPPRHPRRVNWLRTQAINVRRHAEALRPFRRDEFGAGAAAPTDAHVKGANDLVGSLRSQLDRRVALVEKASTLAQREPSTRNLQRMLRLKERAHGLVA